MKISAIKKLIPQEIVERYEMGFHSEGIDIHKPEYIAFGKLENIKTIEETNTVIRINGKTMMLTLWKGVTTIHLVVF